jgi:hypothetical protein
MMTQEYLRQIAWSIHELKLLGRPYPQTEALASQTEELIEEIKDSETS